MGNLKFVKSSIGYCIYLDDNLFNDCGTKFETIMAVLELFSLKRCLSKVNNMLMIVNVSLAILLRTSIVKQIF